MYYIMCIFDFLYHFKRKFQRNIHISKCFAGIIQLLVIIILMSHGRRHPSNILELRCPMRGVNSGVQTPVRHLLYKVPILNFKSTRKKKHDDHNSDFQFDTIEVTIDDTNTCKLIIIEITWWWSLRESKLSVQFKLLLQIQ